MRECCTRAYLQELACVDAVGTSIVGFACAHYNFAVFLFSLLNTPLFFFLLLFSLSLSPPLLPPPSKESGVAYTIPTVQTSVSGGSSAGRAPAIPTVLLGGEITPYNQARDNTLSIKFFFGLKTRGH